jgi:hypothetical protein
MFTCHNIELLAERRRRQQGDLRVALNVSGEEPANITAIS